MIIWCIFCRMHVILELKKERKKCVKDFVSLIVSHFDLWNSMEDILERYERQNHTELTGANTEAQVFFINET